MSHGDGGKRMVLVDASVFITLAEVDLIDALLALDGQIVVPTPVENEITGHPASSALSSAEDGGSLQTVDVMMGLEDAADHLGRDLSRDDVEGYAHRRVEGDIALLALASQRTGHEPAGSSTVVVTDDKPLRKTCKTLSIPVSGSIGVIVQGVERGDLEPATATEKLYAMDEVGARLSASLVRKAERLIDEAAEK